MNGKVTKYKESIEFREFLNREFGRTAVEATIEELAEFAFGSMEEAIQTFEQHKKD